MIEIDLNLIKSYNLTLDEFVLLYLMRMKHYGKVRNFFTEESKLRTLLDKLVLRGHLKIMELGDPDVLGEYSIGVYPRYLDSFVDKMVQELIDTYPQKVTRPDGNIDYLRSNVKIIKEQYKKLIKENREKHEFIIRCLKYQIKQFTNTGKLPYMKRLTKWLENEEWREYEDRIINEGGDEILTETSNDIYGNLID